MPTKPTKILAIDPGTKELGLAIFSGEGLCYYAVKTFKRQGSERAQLAEISNYLIGIVQAYRPQTLAIEKTNLIQKSAVLLNLAAAEIKQTARQHEMAVYEYAPADVRRAICQSSKATKRETAKRIAERYPELSRHLRQPSRWGELYWANIFDAVAVGLVHLNEINVRADGVLGQPL